MKSLFLIPLFLVGVAFGQESNPIGSERPGKTIGTHTVSFGTYQLEFGYTYTEFEDNSHTGDFPQSLFRTGLMKNVELRIGWDGYTLVEDSAGDDIAQDMSLGLKYVFMEQDGWKPKLGVLGYISLPTGIENDEVGGGVNLLASWDINDLTSIGANFGYASVADGEGHNCEGNFSVIINRELNNQFSVFAEYYTTWDEDIDLHSVDVGFAYLANEDFQIDFSVGAGLNDNAPDFTAMVGFTFRF